MGLRDLVERTPGLRSVLGGMYRLYGQRVEVHLARTPHHVGVIMDGNRRWAKAAGGTTAFGHQRGADKIAEFLGWCDETNIEVVTLWMLSTDNLSRPADELVPLLGIIEDAVTGLAARRRYKINPIGTLDLLPDRTAGILKEAATATEHLEGITVNVAVGYGGRHEIADAVRSLLQEHADRGTSIEELVEILDVEHIAERLYTKGQPDPDLVIRTSGEQRLSGFLLWQSAHSEFYFCEAYWPAFRKVDFLRALRAYEQRHRRYGG
ncbi:isoprenyl transferase [Streptomyces tateyamensis]|nr:isoprenyl transferase [Streptomyces tateyamensis]